MPIPLLAYFEDRYAAAKALRKYAQVARERNWTIRDSKLGLYRLGKVAFDEAAENGRSEQAFDEIYRNLRSYWQVFRGAKRYWATDQVYCICKRECNQRAG